MAIQTAFQLCVIYRKITEALGYTYNQIHYVGRQPTTPQKNKYGQKPLIKISQ
jgi:hypothetical protein